jgi:hypothetical protein
MKALTIWQPYATLLLLHLKIYETRSWKTNYRGPLLITAAKRFDADRTQDVLRIRKLLMQHFPHYSKLLETSLDVIHLKHTSGKALGVVQLVSCTSIPDGGNSFENSVGHFGQNRFGWLFENRAFLRTPIACTGKQGLWTPSQSLQNSVKALGLSMFDESACNYWN